MNFQSYSRRINTVFAVLGLILLVLGLLTYSESVYTGVVYVVIGFFQIIIPIIVLVRAGGKTGSEFGDVTVMGCWWTLSVGIAGLALFPSPLLRVSMTYAAVSSIFAALWIVLGAISIRFAISETGAKLVV